MNRKNILIALLVCVVLAAVASVIASSHPDGLKWVAEELGFIDAASEPAMTAPLPDYTIPFINNEYISGVTAGIAGTLLTFVVLYLTARIIRKQ